MMTTIGRIMNSINGYIQTLLFFVIRFVKHMKPMVTAASFKKLRAGRRFIDKTLCCAVISNRNKGHDKGKHISVV